MYCNHLLVLFSVIGVSKGFACTDILEYYDKRFGCRTCAACIKGTGIDLKQKITRTENGLISCYSCYKCQPGTYQNESGVIKSCKPCNSCTNQRILRNCSTTENAICGNCLPGHQVKYGSEICEKIGNFYETVYKFSTICLVFVCLFLLGSLIIIWKKRPKNDSYHLAQEKGIAENSCLVQENGIAEKVYIKIPDKISVNKEIFEVVADTTFALNIGRDWKFVAYQLGFTVADIQEIENNEELLRDCGFCMLIKYRQKHSYQNDELLIKALKEIKRYDLLEQKQVSSEV